MSSTVTASPNEPEHKPRSLGRKMFWMFFGAALIPIASSWIASGALNLVERSQRELGQREFPFLGAVNAAVTNASSLVSLLPRAVASRSEDELNSNLVAYEESLRRLQADVDGLTKRDSEDAGTPIAITSLQAPLDAIQSESATLFEALGSRLAVRDSVVRETAAAATLARQLTELVDPICERPDLSTFEARALQSIRFESTAIERSLFACRSSATPAILADEAAQSLRHLALELVDIPTDTRTVVARAARSLAQALDSTKDPFVSRDRWIEIDTEIDTLSEAIQSRLSLASSAAVEKSNEVQARVDDRLKQAEDAAATGRAILSALALLAVLGSLGVFYFFVRGNVLARLTNLISVSRALSRGQFDVEISTDVDDEIGALNRAIQGFRDSSRLAETRLLALEATTTQLRETNLELEQFIYVASHDLKSPLRAIRGLTEILIEDCQDHLPSESQVHLHLIAARVGRMGRLIDDLLEYSRVSQSHQELTAVDLNTLVREAVAVVDIPDRFEVQVPAELPTLRGDPVTLATVMRNLIDNSIKHHDRPHGTLQITAERLEDMIAIDITDDGPGIPLEFRERVFKAFQTLQSRDVVEGSGIGLSIASRMVRRWGGDLKILDTGADRGTTFRLLWPTRVVEPSARDSLTSPA